MTIINEKLNQFTKDTGISFSILSKATGIKEERLKDIANGNGEEITINELCLLGERVGISLDYLFGMRDFAFAFEPTEENIKKVCSALLS